MRPNVTQRGFTLIELVVVITILGILAAFAVPRFVDLQASAQTASAEALGGSLRSAAALAHALQLATNAADDDTITMEGATVQLENGYPDAATIDDALADYAGYTPAVAGTTATFTSTSDSACTVTYDEAVLNAGPPPTVTPPDVQVSC